VRGRRLFGVLDSHCRACVGSAQVCNWVPRDCSMAWVAVAPYPEVLRRTRSQASYPANCVLFVGAIALLGALILPAIAVRQRDRLGASMLNFGALISFMGVNAAAFVRFYVRADRKNRSIWPPLSWGSSSACCCGGT